jgi:hypothetical protein
MFIYYALKTIDENETLEGFPPSTEPQLYTISVTDSTVKLKESWFILLVQKLGLRYKVTSLLIPLYVYPTDIQNNATFNVENYITTCYDYIIVV